MREAEDEPESTWIQVSNNEHVYPMICEHLFNAQFSPGEIGKADIICNAEMI